MTEQHIQSFPEVLRSFSKQIFQELALLAAAQLSTIHDQHPDHQFLTRPIQALDKFGSSQL